MKKIRMKIQRDDPKFIYVLCVLLSMAFWFVFFSTKMDSLAGNVYFLFLPLTSSPYVMWLIHKEGLEPAEYFKETYGDRVGLVWVVRIFMMVVVSTLGSVAAGLIFGVIALITRVI